MISGPAAAFRHGMLRHAPEVVDVILPAALHRKPQNGIRWHRHDLPPVDRAGGIGVVARDELGTLDGDVARRRALDAEVGDRATTACGVHRRDGAHDRGRGQQVNVFDLEDDGLTEAQSGAGEERDERPPPFRHERA